MKPQILPDLNLVVGLEWALHDNVQEAKKALKGKGKVYYARAIVGVECVQSIVPMKDLPSKAARKARAGALMVASQHPNAVVYHPIDEESVWVCAIRDGIPLPGYDRVLPAHEAQGVIGEAMGYVGNAEVLGALSGSVADLSAVIKTVPAKALKQCLLQTNSLPVLPILGALGFFGLAAGGFLVFENYQAEQAQQQSIAASLAAQMRSAAERQAAAAQARAAFEQQVNALRATLFDATDPGEQYAQWWRMVQSLPLSHQGWVVSAVECAPGTCTVHWVRKDARVPFGVVNGLPGQVESVSGDDAKTVIALEPLPAVHWGAPDTAALQAIIDYPARAAWVSKIKMSIEPPTQPVEVKSPEPEQPATVLAKQGAWRLTAEDPVLAANVVREMALPSVAVESAKFTSFSIGVPKSVEINGRYRVPN